MKPSASQMLLSHAVFFFLARLIISSMSLIHALPHYKN